MSSRIGDASLSKGLVNSDSMTSEKFSCPSPALLSDVSEILKCKETNERRGIPTPYRGREVVIKNPPSAMSEDEANDYMRNCAFEKKQGNLTKQLISSENEPATDCCFLDLIKNMCGF